MWFWNPWLQATHNEHVIAYYIIYYKALQKETWNIVWAQFINESAQGLWPLVTLWMDEWMNEWMNDWTNKQMNGYEWNA